MLVLALLACAPKHVDSDEPQVPKEQLEVAIPGQRVGPLHADANRHDVEKLYPDATVDVDAGPGVPSPMTRVYVGGADEIDVLWTDTTRKHIDAVQIVGTNWHLPEGIGIGTNLDRLEKQLGGPFMLTGFGWDGGGDLVFGGTRLARYDGLLSLGLMPPATDGDMATSWQAVQGHDTFRSDNGNIRKLDPVVATFVVRFAKK